MTAVHPVPTLKWKALKYPFISLPATSPGSWKRVTHRDLSLLSSRQG